MDSSNPLSKLLDANRLTGPNFNDWLRNLRIVLSLEKIDYVLDNPPVKEVQEGANEEEKIASDKWRDDNYRAWCYMLASMTNVLQKQHVDTESAYEILLHLQKMYADLCVKRFSISKKLFRMRMSVESSFNEHVLKMVNYIQQLEELGAHMSKDLAADLILQSLPQSFLEFIMDSNLNKGDYDLSGFVNMLISAETNMKKARCTLLGSTKSSFSKTEIKHKAKIKNTQPKSKVGIKKALLKPKGGIKKAHLKLKGGIKKAQLKASGDTAKAQLNSEGSIEKSELGEVNCQGKCFHCGKEGHLKKDCRVDCMPTKSIEKSELGEVNCQAKCYRCGKKGHLINDCTVDFMPTKSIEKSELGEVNCQAKCYRCGKKGHLINDCTVDFMPTKSIEKNELGEVNCLGKCFRCGKEGHLKNDCGVDFMPTKSIEKSELGEVNCVGKCFRCGKEGHLKKDCRVDFMPTKSISVEENPDNWHMWKKPEFGWIKLNTDGCTKGFGGLFRDHEGKPLCGYLVRSFIDDIFTAELFAVLRGISLAYLQGIKVLWVESDSMCVVKTISREQPCPPTSAIYLDQILQLIGLFQKFQISHSWRECNRAADQLSRMDFRVNDALVNDAVLAPNDLPESLCTIIKEDAGGRLYYRRTSRSTCQDAKVLLDC